MTKAIRDLALHPMRPLFLQMASIAGKQRILRLKCVAASDQSLVFTSPRKNGKLMNLVWSEDSTKLTYEVHVEKGAIEKVCD